MTSRDSPLSATDVLDLYFIENRARLLDIASFLDRVERHEGAESARNDVRYRALVRALALLGSHRGSRTVAIQKMLSDSSTEPIESASGLKAIGASEGSADEGD